MLVATLINYLSTSALLLILMRHYNLLLLHSDARSNFEIHLSVLAHVMATAKFSAMQYAIMSDAKLDSFQISEGQP